jgi:hypothetical protein
MVGQRISRAALPVASILLASGMAFGQSFTANFEAPYSLGVTTGQQGWYLPTVGGLDHNVHAYAGNPMGIVANPGGGTQFSAGEGGANVARCQHDVNFVGGVWQATFDCTGLYIGTLPSVDNLGSFSLQDSTLARYFQQLMTWGSGVVLPYPGGPTPPNHTATGDMFHMPIGYFTAALPTTITFELASAAWMSLPTNHWYRVNVKWNFDTAQILEASIKDLTTNGPTTTDDLSGRGFYLRGGPGSADPLPTAVRLFAGGLGSVTGWDNISVGPVSTACYANCDGSTVVPILNVSDFICFQTKYAAGDTYANCDGSTIPPVLNVSDFICFQTKYSAGCS